MEHLDIVRLHPDDQGTVGQLVEMTRASLAEEAPWDPGPSTHRLTCELRDGWDGEPPEFYVARRDDRVLAAGSIRRSDYDNLDLADLDLVVAVDQRRQGLGSALLAHLAAVAAASGRDKLTIGGWNSRRLTRFATKHGFRAGLHEVQRRQVWSEIEWLSVRGIHTRAAHAALDYELIRIEGKSPDELLPALAGLTSTINDAPLDDLEIDDEVFPVQRIEGYERAVSAWGRLRRVIARHRGTGELAGHTVVAVEDERPWWGEQHDTAVARQHRGHRLGLLLKADLMLWLHEEFTDLRWVDTWNAKSNAHMIAVNEALGYRPVGETAIYQRAFEASAPPEE